MSDIRGFLEDVVYRGQNQRRFTQQSPVMPDVWLEYGDRAGQQVELLLVPNWNHTASELASALKQRLRNDEKHSASLSRFRNDDSSSPRIAFNQNIVVARLWFDQLIRIALPLSYWWHKFVAQLEEPESERFIRSFTVRDFASRICTCLEQADDRTGTELAINYEMIWLARIAGLVCQLSTDSVRSELETIRKMKDHESIIEFLTSLCQDHQLLSNSAAGLLRSIELVYSGQDTPLYRVNLNRSASTSLYTSVPCVKADAARRVFEAGGKSVRWAVVDSGIDALHTAFRKRTSDGSVERVAFRKTKKGRGTRAKIHYQNNTRIIRTYNFVHVRDLLSCDPDDVDEMQRLAKLYPILKSSEKVTELGSILEAMENAPVNWEALEEYLEVPHHPRNAPSELVKYRRGGHHGTHVAGILAADWRASDPTPPRGVDDLVGVCPEIELYDFRILDDDNGGDEFAIISALQFIRHLNVRTEKVQIHGVNLSFSIPHDVANYACGRTPVCDEAELLVKSGLIVVAAAGNSGRARYATPDGRAEDGFRTVSITDPGNADGVITVGSTHRQEPHTYGVSYFSSRGPTGDGRSKPDLVAPGEKILSCAPEQMDAWLDGTSMAAPHVSGAAALLLERYPEFIGHPEKIKDILCSTATDLGRERYYQGAGLLDILRAMQSI